MASQWRPFPLKKISTQGIDTPRSEHDEPAQAEAPTICPAAVEYPGVANDRAAGAILDRSTLPAVVKAEHVDAEAPR
mgnify:CR=1 FL=1